MFDAQGRLFRWPTSAALQDLCLWVLWSRLESRKAFTEKQISELIKGWHVFGDHALLRRALIGWRLVQRTQDGRSIAVRAEAAGGAAAVGCCGPAKKWRTVWRRCPYL